MKSWKKLLGGFMAVSMLVTAIPNVVFGANAGDEEADADGYKLVFIDNFDGTNLDRNVWNVETHEPGWVNSELQAYVDSEENIYVKDGNLVIQSKQDEEGNITSGRINTQNKMTYTYGKFEVRAKVPTGNGYLPAFWLMSNDENIYGQWPRCGEIDCMEVMGSDTKTAYGTIHYGNPHAEKQGTYNDGSDFSADFHTYTCEWEPGKITWFIDGNEYYTTSDWYSVTEGQGELTYPAPFDQPFYMILNLAVGGEWVGYPDEGQVIDQQFVVDYVKVWQKDSYDENVTKPVKEVTYREADAAGNYLHNGDFASSEDLTDDLDWKFLTANGGVGSAAISNKEMVITTENAGSVDYSIQLVQPELPMYKGATYRVSFDAYAASDRTMIVDVSGPDVNYIRYFKDTKVSLTTEKQTFTYEFEMKEKTDANGRLEFNMGKVDNASEIHISNVKVEKIADGDPSVVNAKTPRADGNLIYNGKFQEGTAHLGDWEVSVKDNDASIATASVTGFADGRRLQVVASDKSTAVSDVVLKQTDIPVTGETLYAFSFEAEADREKDITVSILGTVQTIKVGTEKKEYTVSLPVQESYTDKTLVMQLGGEGTVLLDNIRLVEDKLIKNGSFDAGTVGYEIYIDSSASADYVVDSLQNDNALSVTVRDTADQDWKVQIKQNDVPLVNGKWYKLTFDAKSTLDRQIRVIMQGKEDRGWDVYSGDGNFDVSSDFQTYTVKFQMEKETDIHAFLSICLGKVDREITDLHRVVIDNISLVEIDAPLPADANLLQNADFANGMDNWSETIANWGGEYVADASSEVITDGIKYTINNPGTADWHVQLVQHGLTLEEGETYRLKFLAKSTAARTIKPCFMSTSYAWYGGAEVALEANVEQEVTLEITMNTTDTNADFLLSMGLLGNTPASVITLTDFTLVKVQEADSEDEPQTPEKQPVADGINLINNADFADGFTNWDKLINSPADADINAIEEGVEFVVRNPGEQDWNVQIKQHGLYLEEGKTYVIGFVANSTATRTIKGCLMSTNYAWYGGGDYTLEAGADTVIETRVTMQTKDDNADFVLSVGKVGDTPASTITIKGIYVVAIDPTNTDNDDEDDDDVVGDDDDDDDTVGDDDNDDTVGNDDEDVVKNPNLVTGKGDKEDKNDKDINKAGTSDEEEIVGDAGLVQAGKMGDTNALPFAIAIVLFGMAMVSLAFLRKRVRK